MVSLAFLRSRDSERSILEVVLVLVETHVVSPEESAPVAEQT